MASIADLEQLLEQLFERSTTRLFRTRIQAVQLEHRVERAMERSRVGRGSRTEVPSRYRVRVHPDDLDGLAPDADAAQELASRLADAALVFARAHAYHLARRPSVTLVADPMLERGRVEVDVDARQTAAGRSPSMAPAGSLAEPPAVRRSEAPGSPVEPASEMQVAGALKPDVAAGERAGPLPVPARVVPTTPGYDARSTSAHIPDPAVVPEPDAVREPDGVPEPEPSAPGVRGDGAQTHVFRRPAPESARAVLRMLGSDGRERSIEVDGRPLTVGRAPDNGLVIDDTRVSRHHGRLLARHGALVYADLDSTNGSRVNGVRVDEIALGVGDRILVGDTVLVVELLPG